MIINGNLLEELITKAKESPRLRMSLDLRNGSDDNSQRMLNALIPGTEVPIHRHRASSETIILLSGRIDEVFYDDDGHESARYALDPQQGLYGMQIPIGQWHTVDVHEPSVILEVKDGAYAPALPEDLMIRTN